MNFRLCVGVHDMKIFKNHVGKSGHELEASISIVILLEGRNSSLEVGHIALNLDKKNHIPL